MFTWVIKKCLNQTFKVYFLYQKSFESFWISFSLKNISLEEGFLLLSFLENFNFWTTLFLKMVPKFWWCEHLWKSNQKIIFILQIFLLKFTPCWLTSLKLHHLRKILCLFKKKTQSHQRHSFYKVARIYKVNSIKKNCILDTQLPGRLFSPSDISKKLSHNFLLHFPIGMGSHDHHAKHQGVFMGLL